MIPYSRPKLSDLYTLSQGKRLENHTLHRCTDLYSPYMAGPPGGPGSSSRLVTLLVADAYLQIRRGAVIHSFWSKNKGGGPPGPLPWIHHCLLPRTSFLHI